ncbi:plasmid replication protein, partial [Clostridium perfringens]
NISLKQIKNIVNKLKDLGLLIIENVKKRNCYFLPLPNKLPNNENITIPDTTSIEGNQTTPRYIRNNNIDIDSNSNSKEFNADMYEKCTSLVDVRSKVKELLKAARVKSSWIKNKVLTKLSENYRNITVKFLESYINTVIENTRNTYYSNYRKYIKNNANNRVLPNFTERNYSKDYWKYLEENLCFN